MTRLAILGLGYVGLSVASSFRQAGRDIVGFDIDQRRIREIRAGLDATGQVEERLVKDLSGVVTNDPTLLADCREWIVIVQTGLMPDSEPDTRAVLRAAEIISPMLKKGDLVVLSSTVPIGFTEGQFVLALQKQSKLIAGEDFDLAFAPERFDPGNKENTLKTITKIISGLNARALARVRALYQPVVNTMVEAASIKTAEASRLLENVQRDMNIALLNDASRIFKGWNIDTGDVLSVAQTKWNWLPFQPGLVGGHCIPVHSHYMRRAAVDAGVSPDLTTLIRKTTEAMPHRIVQTCLEALTRRGVTGQPTITVMGVAYKENVADVRGSAVIPLIRELTARGCDVQIIDPLARDVDLRAIHAVQLTSPATLKPGDAVILAIPHKPFVEAGWAGLLPYLKNGVGLVIDLRRVLPRDQIPAVIELWRL